MKPKPKMITYSSKDLQAKAENLFAEACRLRGCEVKRIPRRSTKTPDFLMRIRQSEAIAEVKSPGLEPKLEKLMEGESHTLVLRPGKRVRSLIRSAEDQLAAWSAEVPKILVICDLRHLLA